MPLGAVHLIAVDPDHEVTEYFCRTSDAIAAIYPDRMRDFPEDVICAECLRAYRATQANSG
jgi:hypothetical protein